MRAFFLLALISSSAATTTAHAQTDKKASAKKQYDEGTRAFDTGDFRRAGDLFEAAYKASPHHSALWSAARAWMHAKEDVRAANLLERYLREAPANAPDRDNATRALAELDKRLGRIEFLLHDVTDVKLDGEPVTYDRLWVVPGDHVATADANGKLVRKVITVSAGDRVSVTLEPPQAAGGETPASEKKPLPPWVTIVGGGLTVAGAGVTIWSGVDTLDKRDIYLATPLTDRFNAQTRLDDAHASQTRTNVLLGATIGVAAVTTVIAIFFTDWSGGSTPRGAAYRAFGKIAY